MTEVLITAVAVLVLLTLGLAYGTRGPIEDAHVRFVFASLWGLTTVARFAAGMPPTWLTVVSALVIVPFVMVGVRAVRARNAAKVPHD